MFYLTIGVLLSLTNSIYQGITTQTICILHVILLIVTHPLNFNFYHHFLHAFLHIDK